MAIIILSLILINDSDGTLNGIIGKFSAVFPIFILLGCTKQEAQENLALIQSVLMYIFIPSIILHLILFVVNIPPAFMSTMSASASYVFKNYIILVRNEDLYPLRFCSIFLEPGYLGVLCSFLLYTDDFDFSKKCNKVILLALIVSLSLAGWLITFFAYLLYTFKPTPKAFKKLCIILLVGFGIYYGSGVYNGGNNIVNNLIFDRIGFDKNKGIKGNNRFTETTDIYYEWLVKSGKFWNGIGINEINKINNYNKSLNQGAIEGAGYKIFILTKGFSMVVYFVVIYVLLSLSCTNRKYSFIFFGLICLTFIQAAYPLSTSWLVPFCLGLKLHDTKKNLSLDSKKRA